MISGCRYACKNNLRRSISIITARKMSKKRGKAIMIAATREHTGKTSVSMALLNHLIERYGVDNVGYIKPVGQKWVSVLDEKSGLSHQVDKDVKVAKDHWNLTCSVKDMSPLVLGAGYTRRYLDGGIDSKLQDKVILEAFENLIYEKSVVIVEGTGHVGVGSIVKCNNAHVAKLLGIDVVLVANGGLGSTYDQLELNRQMCLAYRVNVTGVVINKVMGSKIDETYRNLRKVLSPWNVSLVGMVPSADDLDIPSINDLEILFGSKALNKERLLYRSVRRFPKFELVTASLRGFMELLANRPDFNNSCFLTHATRHDIILGMLSNSAESAYGPNPFLGCLLLTGSPPGNVPDWYLLEYICASDMPVMSVGMSTTQTLAKLKGYTPKMNAGDSERTASVVQHYAPYLNIDKLLKLMR